MTNVTEREALAETLNVWLQNDGFSTCLKESLRLSIADAILASDWLAQRDVQIRAALGAHVEADAYRDSIPEDDQDAALLRQQETWWRLTARSWLDEDTASACARAAKERVAASPEHQAVIAGLRAALSQEPGRG